MRNCTKAVMEERDITKPCMLMMKELEFYKELDSNKKVSMAKSKYGMMTLDELSKMNDSPVEITIKVLKQYYIES